LGARKSEIVEVEVEVEVVTDAAVLKDIVKSTYVCGVVDAD